MCENRIMTTACAWYIGAFGTHSHEKNRDSSFGAYFATQHVVACTAY